MTRRTEGTTVDGVAIVVIHADHYRDDEVFINGKPMLVRRANRFRDGGTTVYETDGGTLTLPRRINDPDRTPRWGQANIAA
jgi:hypothetical protein